MVIDASLPVLEAGSAPDEQRDLDIMLKEVRSGLNFEKVMMQEQMARNARYEAAITDARTVEGLGQRTSVIPTRVYFRWQQVDPHFWDDKNNVAKFLRDNPECRAARPVKKYFNNG
jgi:hypothetical protein